MSLTELSLAGNNWIIPSLKKIWLVTSRLGTVKLVKKFSVYCTFLSVIVLFSSPCPSIRHPHRPLPHPLRSTIINAWHMFIMEKIKGGDLERGIVNRLQKEALAGQKCRVNRVLGFFSSRPNWSLPPPHPQARVLTPWIQRGGSNTLSRERVMGEDPMRTTG